MDFILKKDLVLTVPWVQAYFEHCNKLNRKSEKKSISTRQEGNLVFKKKQFGTAIELYTKSLLLAPFESEQLSLGYSNRSAALYHLSQYENCIGDIQQTLLCQHVPEHLPSKLSLRKGQCLFQLQRFKEADDEFHKGKSLLEKSTQTEKMKVDKDSQILEFDKWIKKTKFKREQSNLKTPELTTNGSDDQTDILPMVSYSTNELVVKASSAVKLCNNTGSRGRHLLAQHKINAGDVLIVEKPYAAILLPDSSLTHCHNCFVKVSSPFPCPFCCSVQYCSQNCREIAWNSHHRVECRYMSLLHSVGIAHLSLRIILLTGLKNLLDFKSKLDSASPTKTPGLNESGQYDTNYLTVYMLMAHSNDLLAEDLLQYAMTAALLLHILDHAGWFHRIGTCPTNTSSTSISSNKSHSSNLVDILKSDAHLYTASALLRHIQQLVCNAHAITELQISEASPAANGSGASIQTTSQVRVATAIYPTASLMNHSCEPTITSSFQKDTLIVRAVKEVEEGGEIFNCYGPHSYRMSFEERQQLLKDQYFFECHCQSCRNALQQKTLAPDGICPKCINRNPIHLIAETNQLTCNQCGYSKSPTDRSSNIAKAEQAFTKGLYQLDVGNIKVALELFESAYSLRKAELPENDREIGEVLDCIARCMASLGQYKEACKFLSRSISITRQSYGSCSLELAREYQKYCDILSLAGMMKDALKSTAEAKKIFQIHFGLDCPEIKELIAFENELKTKTLMAI